MTESPPTQRRPSEPIREPSRPRLGRNSALERKLVATTSMKA
jgi:hypothetical protein